MTRKKPLLAGATLALAALTLLSAVPPADAKRPRRAAKVRLVPAHQRPDYVGVPGYAGGPPGPAVPGLIDPAIGYRNGDTALIAGLALPADAGAGLLGTGPLFGLPVVGPFGF